MGELLNKATIEMPFDYPPPDIYCPACGKVIFEKGGSSAYCAHTILLGESISGEPPYVSSEYAKTYEELQQDEGVDDATRTFLDRLTKKSILKLEIAISGSGHGGTPISGTMTVAVDFAPGENI